MIDRITALLGLVALVPLFVTVACAILLNDGPPVFFWQRRIGKDGKVFHLVKFRSMRVAAAGTQITRQADRRVTRVGAFLRDFKLDELPQLWNVLRGDMRLVGPRPEVPQFVNPDDPLWRQILAVPPGITDLATLAYRNEAVLLPAEGDVEEYYRRHILPAKMALNIRYLAERSNTSDLRLLIYTVLSCVAPTILTAQSAESTILKSTLRSESRTP